MRRVGVFVTFVISFVVALASAPSRAAPAPPPPLFELCWAGPSVLLDVTVTSVDDGTVTGTVNAVFVRDDADGGPLSSAAPGDEVTVSESFCNAQAGERALLLLVDEGDCQRAFLVDDEGLLVDGAPDEITVEEAAEAALSDDCERALAAAGYDPPMPRENPLVRLLGCTSASPGALDALPWLALLWLTRWRRRGSRSR